MSTFIKISDVNKNDIIIIDGQFNRIDSVVKISPKTVKLFTTVLKRKYSVDTYIFDEAGKLKSIICGFQPHINIVGCLTHKKRTESLVCKCLEIL